MFFVLLHGMSFSEYYSYSRKVATFLHISAIPVQLQHAVHVIGSVLTHIIIIIIIVIIIVAYGIECEDHGTLHGNLLWSKMLMM